VRVGGARLPSSFLCCAVLPCRRCHGAAHCRHNWQSSLLLPRGLPLEGWATPGVSARRTVPCYGVACFLWLLLDTCVTALSALPFFHTCLGQLMHPHTPSYNLCSLHTWPVLLARSCHCSRRPCAVLHAVCCHATRQRTCWLAASHIAVQVVLLLGYTVKPCLWTQLSSTLYVLGVVTWQSLFHVLVTPLSDDSAQQGQQGLLLQEEYTPPPCDMPTDR
jgi:hypothetical protein